MNHGNSLSLNRRHDVQTWFAAVVDAAGDDECFVCVVKTPEVDPDNSSSSKKPLQVYTMAAPSGVSLPSNGGLGLESLAAAMATVEDRMASLEARVGVATAAVGEATTGETGSGDSASSSAGAGAGAGAGGATGAGAAAAAASVTATAPADGGIRLGAGVVEDATSRIKRVQSQLAEALSPDDAEVLETMQNKCKTIRAWSCAASPCTGQHGANAILVLTRAHFRVPLQMMKSM